VDLPAPFSPKSATSSPSYTSRSMPDKTTLVSKLFSIPRRDSRGMARLWEGSRGPSGTELASGELILDRFSSCYLRVFVDEGAHVFLGRQNRLLQLFLGQLLAVD